MAEMVHFSFCLCKIILIKSTLIPVVRMAQDIYGRQHVQAILMPKQFRLVKISSKFAFGTLQNKHSFLLL